MLLERNTNQIFMDVSSPLTNYLIINLLFLHVLHECDKGHTRSVCMVWERSNLNQVRSFEYRE